MTNWQTKVSIKKPPFPISLGSSFYSIGSCFSNHLQNSLSNNLFYVTPSPFGIEYNFISMSQGLSQVLSGNNYQLKDLIKTTTGYSTWAHHSQVTFQNQNELLLHLNKSLEQARLSLNEINYLIITPGTSYCYYLKDTSVAVNNCHKMPQTLFTRRSSSIEEIISSLAPCLDQIKNINKKVKFIFTLSPVKHLRDDPTENSYSKAICRCAIEELVKKFNENSYYFPSYEIMTDELRDYRFYDENMTHPSTEATQFIISKFFETFLNENDLNFIKEWIQITKFLQHKNDYPSITDYLNANPIQKNKILTLKSSKPHLNWAAFSKIF